MRISDYFTRKTIEQGLGQFTHTAEILLGNNINLEDFVLSAPNNNWLDGQEIYPIIKIVKSVSKDKTIFKASAYILIRGPLSSDIIISEGYGKNISEALNILSNSDFVKGTFDEIEKEMGCRPLVIKKSPTENKFWANLCLTSPLSKHPHTLFPETHNNNSLLTVLQSLNNQCKYNNKDNYQK